MDERLRFVARLLDGEKMAALCREFDISRKTGYKIFQRYKDCGLEGLTDRSRRPYRHANQLPFQIEKLIVQLKQERPSWGAPKIREKLGGCIARSTTPAISTVHAVLDRHGLVSRGRKRRYKAAGHAAVQARCRPNDLWCADYKGEFMLADRRYCYPLTITDFASRYLLELRGPGDHQGGVRLHRVRAGCSRSSACPRPSAPTTACPSPAPLALRPEQARRCGGCGWASTSSASSPAIPQQNGRHERMHLTLKKEATKPAAKNFLQQQAKFDRLHRLLQPRAAASGARHEVSRPSSTALTAPVSAA